MSTNTEEQKPDSPEKKQNFVKRIWGYRKFIIIEPILVFWILPAAFNFIGVQNLGLEKACRVNLGYERYICENMLDKAINNIDCDTLPEEGDNSTMISLPDFYNQTVQILKNATEDDFLKNATEEELEMFTNRTIEYLKNSSIGAAFFNETDIDLEGLLDIEKLNETLQKSEVSSNLAYRVCKAERETQKLVSYVSGIRGPISSVFPIIVILFAGGWSDRHGVRKPCMYFPMVGEALASVALLLASIFMEELPMEFGNILEKVMPAMFGGQTLMIMGIYSYLTAITDEKDRTFRFGIFAIVGQIVPIVGSPVSGKLYKNLGYVNLFILCLCLQVAGIIYIIFFIKEVKQKPKSESSDKANKDVKENGEQQGHDNLALELQETGSTSDSQSHLRRRENANANNTEPKPEVQNGAKPTPPSEEKPEDDKPAKPKNCCLDFFDPTSAYDCVKVYTKKRENNRRLFLLLLTIAYTLFLGPSLGEIDYLYQYALIALNWNEDQYSFYSTYSFAIVIVGTFLMTAIFSKALKMSDSMVGLLASLCTIVSRPMFAFARESILYYAACTVDMFVSIKALAIKSIISAFVEPEEIGRLYSVLGITDALGGFIFPPIYSAIYSSTIDTFPGAFYLFGEIFFVPNAILFAITWKFSPRGKPEDEETGEGKDDAEGNNNEDKEEAETTYM